MKCFQSETLGLKLMVWMRFGADLWWLIVELQLTPLTPTEALSFFVTHHFLSFTAVTKYCRRIFSQIGLQLPKDSNISAI
jgi:hypothetical protein